MEAGGRVWYLLPKGLEFPEFFWLTYLELHRLDGETGLHGLFSLANKHIFFMPETSNGNKFKLLDMSLQRSNLDLCLGSGKRTDWQFFEDLDNIVEMFIDNFDWFHPCWAFGFSSGILRKVVHRAGPRPKRHKRPLGVPSWEGCRRHLSVKLIKKCVCKLTIRKF